MARLSGIWDKSTLRISGAWVMRNVLIIKRTPSKKWQICPYSAKLLASVWFSDNFGSFFSFSCLAFAAVESTLKLDWWVICSHSGGSDRSLFYRGAVELSQRCEASQARHCSGRFSGLLFFGRLQRLRIPGETSFQLFGAQKKVIADSESCTQTRKVLHHSSPQIHFYQTFKHSTTFAQLH